jgi:hypothetical protein
MKCQSDRELWERVKALEGKTLYTITRGIPNKILRVTENRVEIQDKTIVYFNGVRGIFENYDTLIEDGYLIGESGEDSTMKANLRGRSVIMAILHKVMPDEIEKIKGGIREV